MRSSSDRPVTVLVVEDSATSRRLLCELLAMDPGIRVVGEARDGREAVQLAAELKPDAITMDITMPELDGFEAMKRILAARAVPIVIVTSHADAGQLSFSMQALRAGALAVVSRPVGPAAPEFESVAREIQRTVKSLARIRPGRALNAPAPAVAASPPVRDASAPRPRVLAVATSAGGPPALQVLLSGLTKLPIPIVIVQHIAEGFVSGLADWLTAMTGVKVCVAARGEELLPGTAYLAPDAAHLLVTRQGRVDLDSTTRHGRFRPSADALLGSVAEAYGAASLGVILTGMGSDGVEGAKKMQAAGARVLVQDPLTAAVSGMPESAVEAGVAAAVLALEGMGAYVRRIVGE